MKPRMIFCILFFFVFFILFLSFWGFWQATHPAKITSSLTPKDLGWQFEDVSLKTEDGLKLSAWFVPSFAKASEDEPAKHKSDKAIIILHGYPADKGDLLYWSVFLQEDYNLLFFDFRYFGGSEGSYTSLGYHERKDVLAAIELLKKRGVDKIGLMGFSFGASVALLTLPQTRDVDAVVADSAFANLDLMGEVYYGNIPLLPKPLILLTKFWGRLVYGIDANEIVPESAVEKTQIPIFLVASREDETVSVKNIEKLKEALRNNKNTQVWIRESGIHGEITSGEYQEKTLQFFKKNL